MEYPHINPHIQEAELVEHFTLTREERFLLSQLRKKTNIIGFAVLLKSFIFLGRPLRNREDVPAAVITYTGQQLKLNPNLFSAYTWKDSNWKTHLSIIRKFTGFRPGSANDFQELAQWLVDEANNHSSRTKMFSAATKRCRRLCMELPTESELQRLVNSAWRQYLDVTCQKIFRALSTESKGKIDQCLAQETNSDDQYEWIKANPGKLGIKNLLTEIKRLQYVNSCGIKEEGAAPTRCTTLQAITGTPYWSTLSQNCCHRPAVLTSSRKRNTVLIPNCFQRIPDLQKRCLIKVLQAASVTPDPIGKSFSTCSA